MTNTIKPLLMALALAAVAATAGCASDGDNKRASDKRGMESVEAERARRCRMHPEDSDCATVPAERRRGGGLPPVQAPDLPTLPPTPRL